MALFALSSKVQVPRWISATAGSLAGAGAKSPGSQPEVELGSGVGGITRSLVGTTTPVTSPVPEKSKVPVS